MVFPIRGKAAVGTENRGQRQDASRLSAGGVRCERKWEWACYERTERIGLNTKAMQAKEDCKTAASNSGVGDEGAPLFTAAPELCAFSEGIRIAHVHARPAFFEQHLLQRVTLEAFLQPRTLVQYPRLQACKQVRDRAAAKLGKHP